MPHRARLTVGLHEDDFKCKTARWLLRPRFFYLRHLKIRNFQLFSMRNFNLAGLAKGAHENKINHAKFPVATATLPLHGHEFDFEFGVSERRSNDDRIETKAQRFGIDAAQCANTHGDGLHRRQVLALDFLQNRIDDGSGYRKLMHGIILPKVKSLL